MQVPDRFLWKSLQWKKSSMASSGMKYFNSSRQVYDLHELHTK